MYSIMSSLNKIEQSQTNGFFEGPFICREHDFKSVSSKETEHHLTTVPHYARFGNNGRCRYCPKKKLYFHNVLYVGLPLMYDLICKDCSVKLGRQQTAYDNPVDSLKHYK